MIRLAARTRLRNLLTLAAKWEALKLAWFIGAVSGMLFMAVLLTSGRALQAIAGAL